MTTEAVTVEQFIAAPPAKVWAALTQPQWLERWWAPGEISANTGHRFTLDMDKWGHVECQVLESDPERRFVYTFGDWTLTWTLEPQQDGTLLRLVHSGFDLEKSGDRFALDNMGEGWRGIVLPRLAELLDKQAA